ncbi:MAG TPA: hypothetical protein VF067_02755 [Sphingomicrobium sp.]
MAILRFKSAMALLAAGSMVVSSTGAAAATTSLPSSQQIDPWAALSVMSAGAPAAALCGAAATVAAAAQPAPGCVLPVADAPVVQTVPPPPTPVPAVEPVGGGLGISPLLLALGALAIGVAAYFLLRHHHHHATSPA